MSARQDRVIELQRQLRTAILALERIKHGCRGPEAAAEKALDEIWSAGPKQPLQVLVGHEKRARI